MTVGRIRKRRNGHWCAAAAEGTDTKRDCARLLQTTPPKLLTKKESSEQGDVCGVEWECGLNGAGDKDDGILGRRWDSTEQSKWKRLTAVVGLGSSRKRFTGKRLQASGFVELAESESATMVRGSSRFTCPTGMWREAHGKWQK